MLPTGGAEYPPPFGVLYDMSSPYLKQAVANHTEGTVSVWNNGDGNDRVTREDEGFETSTNAAVVVLIGANNYG